MKFYLVKWGINMKLKVFKVLKDMYGDITIGEFIKIAKEKGLA